MKRKLASIQKISKLEPIPGAGKIEVATVLGWSVVVKKGDFEVGDSIVYFEIDSFLPIRPEFEFLSKNSKPKIMLVEGKEIQGYRLRTIRLRGQISQGLILPHTFFGLMEGSDVSKAWGIIKYEQPIPACLSGMIRAAFPGGIPKTDEPRIQAYPKLLEEYADMEFYCTEKIDGASGTFFLEDGELRVCSRNCDLKETESNSFWRIARKYEIKKKLEQIEQDGFKIALQGEVYGFGIQGNPLKISDIDVAFFNAYDIKNGKYLDYEIFVNLLSASNLPRVPLILDATFPKTIEGAILGATRKSTLNHSVWAEGFVWRPYREMRDLEIGRLSFKIINPEYLLQESEEK